MSRHPTGAHDLTASRLRSMRTEGDMRHFLNLSDAGGDAGAEMLSDAIDRKAERRGWQKAKPDADRQRADHEHGRAQCRERGCKYVEITEVDVSIKKKQK